MAVGSLDPYLFQPDNRYMERTNSSRLRLFCILLALAGICGALTGCAGVSAGTNNQSTTPPTSGTLAVSPATLNFGNVPVGSSASLNATLSASNTDVTISSADWSGSGYAVSGITFPVTVAAGQTAKYTVTFSPAATGSSPGSITFTSNASDASLKESFSGSGTQTSTHSVALSWDPSTSTVIGYNLYRGTQTGGPYSTKLNSSLLATTAFTDSNVQSGTTYYYVSTAVDSNNIESGYSNEASAPIP